MSHHDLTSLTVLLQRELTTCYGPEASEALAGEKIPRRDPRPGNCAPYYRHLSITSRGGWAQDRLQALGREAGVDGLRFLAGNEPTHRVRTVITDNDEQPVWAEIHGYTVLTARCEEVLSSLERVQRWCEENAARAGKVLDVGEDDVVDAMRSASFSLAPGDEGFGDGDLPEFVFSVLRTMIELMRFAWYQTKNGMGLWVVYHQMLESGRP